MISQTTVPANIAVIGMNCRFPGAANPDEYWRNLREGVESISSRSDSELLQCGVAPAMLANPRYVKACAALDDAEGFDAAFFGFSAREAELMDPQHRHFLECSYSALEDAGYDPSRYEGLIGVYAGSTMNTYLPQNLLSRRDVLDVVGDLQIMIGNDKEYLASRVSYKLDLRGPSCVVQTACSSSLVAIHVACQAILSGECDMALAGGSSVRMPPGGGYLHQPGGTSSPDGHCRAFDAQAGGSAVGSGAGVVVLKHLRDALADGDHVYAVVNGTAINNDGAAKVSFTAPSVDGQARAAASALLAANVSAEEIGFVEAHGTGTPLGDPIEVAALERAFRETTEERQYCALGSAKTNIGHLDAAAGVAGFIKTVQAVRHGLIPPTLHFSEANPQINFDNSPFFVNNRLIEWPGTSPRKACTNSIGMGGTNAHVVIEEPPELVVGDPSERGQLLVVSAETPTALDAATANLSAWLGAHPAANLADVAATLQRGRRRLRHRRAVVVTDLEDATYALGAPRSARAVTGDGHVRTVSEGVAFAFPGQGVQFPGMIAGLYRKGGRFAKIVDECLSLLDEDMSMSLTRLLTAESRSSADASALSDTAMAQPALFITEYATGQALAALTGEPRALIGHSVGEIVAAALAGVIPLEQALSFVVTRGAAMAKCPSSSMLSVAAGEADLRPYLTDGVEVAGLNAPELVTLSGETEATEAAAAALERDGIIVRRLTVSHGFHSAMMSPALDELMSAAQRLNLAPPTIPIVSTLTGDWLTEEEATDPRYWVRQAREPVRFADGWSRLAAMGGVAVAEVGAGATLTAFGRACGTGEICETVTTLPTANSGEDAWSTFLAAVGTLWVSGVEVDWDGLWSGTRRQRLPLPTYPFEHKRFWVEVDRTAESATLAAAEDSLERRGDPVEWLYIPQWRQATPPSSRDDGARGAVLITGDDASLAEALASEIEARGRDCRVIGLEGFGSAEMLAELEAALPADGRRETAPSGSDAASHVVVIASPTIGDGPADITGEMRGLLATAAVFGRLDAIRTPSGLRITVVTRGACNVVGDEDLLPSQTALISAAIVSNHESDGLRTQCVDLPSVTSTAELEMHARSLAAEILAAEGPGPVIALRGGRRWHRRHAPAGAPAAHRPSSLGRGENWVVIGGLGFMGRTIASHLSGVLGSRVMLLDRRPPTPGEREWFQASDGLVSGLECDCGDEGELSRVLSEFAAEAGRIDGILIAAGPAAHEGVAMFSGLPEDALQSHADTRMRSVRALAATVEALDVGVCVVASSLVAVLGGVGTAAYAASTLWVESFVAMARRRSSARWIVVDWEHWEIPGELQTGSAREQYAISGDDLSETLELVLNAGHEEIAISTASIDARLRDVLGRATRDPEQVNATGGESDHPRPEIGTPYIAPRSEEERYVAESARELLGIDRVGVADNLFELGADSLMAMQLVSNLRDHYRAQLLMPDFFREPTVEALVRCVAAGQRNEETDRDHPDAGRVEEPAAEPANPSEELDALLEEVSPEVLADILAEFDTASRVSDGDA